MDPLSPKAPTVYELLAILDTTDMEPTEQAAVWTLIQYLKRKEAGKDETEAAAR